MPESSSKAAYSVGTPGKTVTRSRTRLSTTLIGNATERSSTRVAPNPSAIST